MLSKGRIESILMGLSFTVLNAKTESTNNNESEGDANCWTEVAHAEQRVSAANESKNPPSPPPPPTDQRLAYTSCSTAATVPSMCPSVCRTDATSVSSATAPSAGA